MTKRMIKCTDCESCYFTKSTDLETDMPLWVCNNCGTAVPRRVLKAHNKKINASQMRAIETFKNYISKRNDYSKFPTVLENFEVTPTSYGTLWVSARTAQGEAGTLLHAVSTDYWHVSVERRGKLIAYSAPDWAKDLKTICMYPARQEIHVAKRDA
jgi:hypothetical protein